MTDRNGKANVLVLTIGKFQIWDAPACFIVAEKATRPTVKTPMKSDTYTYHTSLADALCELSDRLLSKKLADRATTGQDDLTSLARLLEAHRAEMQARFKTL